MLNKSSCWENYFFASIDPFDLLHSNEGTTTTQLCGGERSAYLGATMFGLFGGKDWNVLAVIFERRDMYQVSGQRVKGKVAEKARDGAKGHPRTVFYAVFNQEGTFIEGGPGAGQHQVPADVLKKLERELAKTRTVLDILKSLETKESTKLAKPLVWHGYPPRQMHGADEQTDEP